MTKTYDIRNTFGNTKREVTNFFCLGEGGGRLPRARNILERKNIITNESNQIHTVCNARLTKLTYLVKFFSNSTFLHLSKIVG